MTYRGRNPLIRAWLAAGPEARQMFIEQLEREGEHFPRTPADARRQARQAALDAIAELPLTEDEWCALLGLAILAKAGAISIEAIRETLGSPGTGAAA